SRPEMQTKKQVDARAEFDQADALPARDRVSSRLIADDPPRHSARDLFHDDRARGALDGEGSLLVLVRGLRTAGNQKTPGDVLDARDRAGDRRAVHVNVENIEKNTHLPCRAAGKFKPDEIDHAAIGGRNQSLAGTGSLRITEKVKGEEPE